MDRKNIVSLTNLDINLRVAKEDEIGKAFELFKLAAESLDRRGIDQWQYWKTPPVHKIKWVQEGFSKNEFYFIENANKEIMGMIRVLDEDLLYWGAMPENAKYIHSLVVDEKYAGYKIGSRVLEMVESNARNRDIKYLRLDCDASNKNLCKYYENQGFQKVGFKQFPPLGYNLYQRRIK